MLFPARTAASVKLAISEACCIAIGLSFGGVTGGLVVFLAVWLLNAAILTRLYQKMADEGNEHCSSAMTAMTSLDGGWPLWVRVGAFLQFAVNAAILPIGAAICGFSREGAAR